MNDQSSNFAAVAPFWHQYQMWAVTSNEKSAANFESVILGELSHSKSEIICMCIYNIYGYHFNSYFTICVKTWQ